MKITKKHKLIKISNPILIIGTALAVISVCFVLLQVFRPWDHKATLQENEQTQSVNHPKTETDDSDSDDNQITQSNTKNKIDDANTKESSGTVSITALSQTNDDLNIRTLMSNIVNTGICTLSLTKDSSVLSFKTNVQPGPSTSTCQGFDLSISQQHITAGDWVVNIVVESDTMHASTSDRITIK